MELAAWLNLHSPDGPCFDPNTNPIPGLPTSLSMLDAICRDYLGWSPAGPVNVLEIGSFVGISAITLGNVLKNSGREWKICCCDMWHHFGYVQHTPKRTITRNFVNSFNHEIFKFNLAKSLGFENVIELIGDSRKTLPLLSADDFDIVYVDGFHGYSIAKSDIEHAKRVCRPGGIICGDDYDCTADMLARVKSGDLDRDCQPLDGVYVHAGVVRAVNELLGEPQCFGAFWAFRKEDKSTFSPIYVAALPRRIPSFIPEQLHSSFRACLDAPFGLPLDHPFGAR